MVQSYGNLVTTKEIEEFQGFGCMRELVAWEVWLRYFRKRVTMINITGQSYLSQEMLNVQ